MIEYICVCSLCLENWIKDRLSSEYDENSCIYCNRKLLIRMETTKVQQEKYVCDGCNKISWRLK